MASFITTEDGKRRTKGNPCCDDLECAAYRKRSRTTRARCLIYRRGWERNRIKERKIKVLEYLGNKCRDCNAEFDPFVEEPTVVTTGKTHKILLPHVCFDIEHVKWENKKFPVSGGHLRKRWDRIVEEIDNCECVILCKHCHVIATQKLFKNKEYMKIKNKTIRDKYYNRLEKGETHPSETGKALNSTSA